MRHLNWKDSSGETIYKVNISQQAITVSKAKIETLLKGVKYVQS